MKRPILTIKLLTAAVLARLRGGGIKMPGYWKCCFRSIQRLHAEDNTGYYHVGKAFLEARMRVISDRLTVSEDPADPILIVAVKDDLARMRLLFSHYRRLGVAQFVVLDNGSTDGTAEFCAEQPDTRVYHVATRYAGNRKEGWIERVIRSIGVDRWYIVVDSDEMLDYPGSEHHDIRELIRRQSGMGNTRLYGYMLDMYSDRPLYTVDCPPERIPEEFPYFDDDTYTMGESLYGMLLPMGGPRQRLAGGKFWAGKCPVFLFTEDMNILTAHFAQPIVPISDSNLCTVLRHYKYLRTDREIYRYRESGDSGFGHTTCEYRAVNARMDEDEQRGLYRAGSRQYKDSYSLLSLPRLHCTFPREGSVTCGLNGEA